jgi:hypothetical protein
LQRVVVSSGRGDDLVGVRIEGEDQPDADGETGELGHDERRTGSQP